MKTGGNGEVFKTTTVPQCNYNLVAEAVYENGEYPDRNSAVWRRQIAILRHCIGNDTVKILNHPEFDDTSE